MVNHYVIADFLFRYSENVVMVREQEHLMLQRESCELS
jgi:hypothetical protein